MDAPAPIEQGERGERLKELSSLELAVMSVVWDLGECSSAEVVERFCARRQLAATTIRTVLAAIEKKGYVERVPTVERSLRFRPRVSREAVAGRSLQKLVRGLFGGSAGEAVAYLLREGEIQAGDLDEIRRLLDARTSRQGS
jgi:predicted transcriptional regulator